MGETGVLFRRVDVVDNVQKHSERTLPSPVSHELLLISLIAWAVIIGVFVFAKHHSLADKIDSMRSAAKTVPSGSKSI